MNPGQWSVGFTHVGVDESGGGVPAQAWALWLGPIGFQATVYYTQES